MNWSISAMVNCCCDLVKKYINEMMILYIGDRQELELYDNQISKIENLAPLVSRKNQELKSFNVFK